MNLKEEALRLHRASKGKISTASKVKIETKEDLSLAYTPGVAEVCKEIYADRNKVFEYTIKSNSVAVISDGSAVLGLGNIGAEAALPVMEGKCAIFKRFAGIDAFPRCFEIESALQNIGIPVFHDDQHGSAIVVLAALINSAKVVNKKPQDLKIVISGAGAAGTAVTKLLLCFSIDRKICTPVKEIILCDSKGIIYDGRHDLDYSKKEISKITNPSKRAGTLKDALKNADVFIGLSKGNLLTKDMIKLMSQKPIIFAMANPIPEIMPDEAKEAGAAVVGTGRSDFPNQINNSLAFPAVFRGALDAKAKSINNEMKTAAANALAACVKNPAKDNILPSMFEQGLVKKVSEAVKKTAIETNAIRK